MDVKLSVTIARGRSELDQEIARLHREATACKGGDWPGAIRSLARAVSLMEKSGLSYPAEKWLRLGVFLQQAGKFEDAMRYLSRMLDDAEHRIAKEALQCSELERRRFTCLWKAQAYDKMRLVCKRQGKATEAARFEELRDNCRSDAEQLEPLIEQEWEQQQAAYRARRDLRRSD